MKIEEELQSCFESELQKARLNIIYTGNCINQQVEHFLRPFGLTAEQFNVLRILEAEHPDPLCLKEITGRMVNRHTNTTRIIDHLLEKKLVRKEHARHDARELVITINDKGKELLKVIALVWNKNNAPGSPLSKTELKELNNLLDKIRNGV
jgi:DNA-binding MarR family transcriptional regulator